MLKLKILRIQKGIKQKALAARCGIRPATICDLENGRTKNPRSRTLRKIAAELGVPIDALFDDAAA
jgi:putative transcriptional regulator